MQHEVLVNNKSMLVAKKKVLDTDKLWLSLASVGVCADLVNPNKDRV